MPRELLISAGPGDYRAALIEDGAVVELYVERGDTRPPGSIVLGRVVRRAPGLDSAFVEIGDPRPGIVPLREAAADGLVLDEGGRVVVQVRREAMLEKGARLSTRLSAAGVDRRAPTLRAASLDPPAVIHALAAADAAHPEGLAAALSLRVPGMPGRIAVDDVAVVPELRAAFPGIETVPCDPADWPLDIDAAIDAALAPRVGFGDGGILHIDETETATMIDVDSGTPERGEAGGAALSANLAAAAAVARHIRLRNLGGGIIVDFVGLDGRGPREQVRQALAAALAPDPSRPQVLGWTRLGHLEIVRPRRARSLAAAMLEPAGTRPRQAAALARDALRALWRQNRAEPGKAWTIAASPAVAAALDDAASAVRALEARLGRPLAIKRAGEAATRAFDIVAG